MNDLYRKTFDEVHASEALRQEVLNMTKQEKTVVRRQVPRMVLIAAIVVLALAGTALAAALPGIQEWFSQQWTKETGKAIETDQMGIITGLTDDVGVSASADGVTVTVDSVTRGEGAMWFLIKVKGIPPEEELAARLAQQEAPELDRSLLPEGWEPSPIREFDFLDMELTLTPALADEIHGWGCHQQTCDENGTWSFLMTCEAPADSLEITPMDAESVTLKLEGLRWGGRIGVGQILIAEGPWELTFSLSPIKQAASLTTGPCTLPAYLRTPDGWDSTTMGTPPSENVAFQEIQVTATGCTLFWADLEQAERTHFAPSWSLVMKDGTELELDTSGRYYYEQPDGTAVTRKSWPVPVDLRQADTLKYTYEGTEYTLELK